MADELRPALGHLLTVYSADRQLGRGNHKVQYLTVPSTSSTDAEGQTHEKRYYLDLQVSRPESAHLPSGAAGPRRDTYNLWNHSRRR